MTRRIPQSIRIPSTKFLVVPQDTLLDCRAVQAGLYICKGNGRGKERIGDPLYVYPCPQQYNGHDFGGGFWLQFSDGDRAQITTFELNQPKRKAINAMLHRKYIFNPSLFRPLLDYLWSCYAGWIAVTPWGPVKAQTPEASEALTQQGPFCNQPAGEGGAE